MTSNKWNLPIKYQEKFEKLLSELENDSGEMFQLTINKFGVYSNENQIIGDFECRNLKIEVYECDPEYEELLGTYDSRDHLINKIKNINNKLAFSEIKESKNSSGSNIFIGKCIECGHENDVRHALCQNTQCVTDFRSVWNYIRVSSHNYDIYICHGGTFARCTNIGKYRFV